METLPLSNELEYNIYEFIVTKGYPYNTLKTYGNILKRLFREYKELNKEAVVKLLKKFKYQNQRAVLLLINKYCYQNNIDFKIVIPQLSRQKKKITIKTLPTSEINIIIKAAPKPYDLMLKCIFKIGGGLRISEAIKLCWYHFFWANWLENKAIGSVLIKDSKGDDRIIPVPKAIMFQLYNLAKENNLLNEFGIPVGDLIFGDIDSYKPKLKAEDIELWKNQYVSHTYDWFRYNIIQKCCEPAVGHKIRVHSLRHTRATNLYDEENIPIEIIQQLLGHKEITTTMIYTQVSNRKVFDAMKDVN